jgi:hypothetical protein
MVEEKKINGMVDKTLGNEPTTLCGMLDGIKDNISGSKPYRFMVHTVDSALTVVGRSFTTNYNVDFHAIREYMESTKEARGSAPYPIPSDYGFRKNQ